MAQRGSKAPTCARCGINHQAKHRDGMTDCFKSEKESHFLKKCPKSMREKGINGGRNHLYVVASHQEQEDFPDVVIGMIQIFDFTIYALLYLGTSLSFLTPYVAMYFDVIPEKLSEPFNVSTHVGEPFLA